MDILRTLLAPFARAWWALVSLGERSAQSSRVSSNSGALLERPVADGDRAGHTAEVLAVVAVLVFIAALLANAALHA